MKIRIVGFSVMVVVLMAGLKLLSASASDSATYTEAQIQHGEYLVKHVAMCVQCHSPRLADGQLDRSKLFQGAPMPVRSPFPNTQWAVRTPALAGLPGWADDDIIHFLMTGRRFNGQSPLPPMPPFRMSREDATAVVAYLRSLR